MCETVAVFLNFVNAITGAKSPHV